MSIFTRKFALETTERSVKTWAQTAAALLVGGGVGILDVAWASVLSISTLAAIVSVLTSIGSGYVGDDTPSLVD